MQPNNTQRQGFKVAGDATSLPRYCANGTKPLTDAQFTSVSKVIDVCKSRTMYSINSVVKHTSHVIDCTTTAMLLDRMLSCVHSEQDIAADIERGVKLANGTADIPSDSVCPWSAVRMAYGGFAPGVYDVDGVAWLCWQALGHLAAYSGDHDSAIKMAEFVRDAMTEHGCRVSATAIAVPSSSAIHVTCSPLRAVSLPTIEQCLVPPGTCRDAVTKYSAVVAWDMSREATIADILRSVHLGGAPIASVITSTFCTVPPDADSTSQSEQFTSTSGSSSTVVTTIKPKRPKVQRKWSELHSRKLLSQAISARAAASSLPTTAPITERGTPMVTEPATPGDDTVRSPVAVAANEQERSMREPMSMTQVDAAGVAAAIANIAKTSNALDAAKRMLEESMQREVDNPARRSTTTDAFVAFEHMEAVRGTATTTTTFNGAHQSQSGRSANTGGGAAAATTESQRLPIKVTEILRAPPKRGVVGSLQKEDEFGDPEFDSTSYTLKAVTATDDTGSHQVGNSSDARRESTRLIAPSVQEFITKTLDADPSHSRCEHTHWCDLAFGDANTTLGPYARSYPCACLAELITSISNSTAKHVIEHHTNCIRHGDNIGFESLPGWAAAFGTRDRLFESLAVDMAIGVVPDALRGSAEFKEIMNADKALMRHHIPVVISRAFTAATHTLQWTPTLPSRGDNGGVNPADCLNMYTTQAPFTMTSGSSKYIDSQTDKVAGVIRLWCKLVQKHRDALMTALCEPDFSQDWAFAAVSPAQGELAPVASAVCDTYESGDVIRALELASASSYLGTTDARTLVFDTPDAYPCDVCHVVSLAASALGVRDLAIGASIVRSTTRGSRSVIALPYRNGSLPHHPDPTDGIVFGTMLMLMSRVDMHPASNLLGCDNIAPFAFAMLCCGPSAQLIDMKNDEANELKASDVSGTDAVKRLQIRAKCWDVHIRAAVGYVSDVLKRRCVETPVDLENPRTIPLFSADVGALCEDSVRGRYGWHKQSVELHTLDALYVYRNIGKLAAIALSALDADADGIALGIICMSRPLRHWVVNRERFLVIARAAITASSGSSGTFPNEINVSILRTSVAYAESDQTSQWLHIGVDTAVDLASQVAANATMVALMLWACDAAPSQAVGALQSLRLWKYTEERFCCNMAGASDEPAIFSCSDGSLGALPSGGIDVDQQQSLRQFTEDSDGGAIPSQHLLATAFIEVFSATHTATGADRLLNMICASSPQPPSVGGMLASMAKCDAASIYVPLAYRQCSTEYLMPTSYIPMPDNMMTLARSHRMACRGCNKPLSSDPRSRTLGQLSKYDRALLPKNSPLLTTLVHYRNGAVVLPHATASEGTNWVDPNRPHVYSAELAKVISAGTPKGTPVHVQRSSDQRTRASQHEDDNTTECAFPTDPAEFEALMAVENAESKRADAHCK